MQKLISFKNDDAIIMAIGDAISKCDLKAADEMFFALNEQRIMRNDKPLSLTDSILLWGADFFYRSKNEGKTKLKSVYIAEFSDETVKIGVSYDVQSRIKQLSCQKGFNVIRYTKTQPIVNAEQIERELHKHFANYRLKGEYFGCKYEDVTNYINDIYAISQ